MVDLAPNPLSLYALATLPSNGREALSTRRPSGPHSTPRVHALMNNDTSRPVPRFMCRIFWVRGEGGKEKKSRYWLYPPLTLLEPLLLARANMAAGCMCRKRVGHANILKPLANPPVQRKVGNMFARDTFFMEASVGINPWQTLIGMRQSFIGMRQ